MVDGLEIKFEKFFEKTKKKRKKKIDKGIVDVLKFKSIVKFEKKLESF